VGADGQYVVALTVFQARIFFVTASFSGDIHTERSTLWSSDGTAAGSAPLFDLPAIYVFYLSAFEDTLYFEGQDRERFFNFLYRSDGTEAGTQELVPADLTEPPSFLRFDGQTFFVDGENLWKTDGTPEGTRTITVPGGAVQGAVDLAPLGDRFYFMGRSRTDPNDYQGTPALFRTDGTQAATVPVKTFSPVPTYDTPKPQLTVLDGALFFVAADAGHGAELWRTDGTTAGTELVVDVNPGPDSARISGLTSAGGRLFFAADDGEHGIELWTSDGTAAGTRRLSDIAEGPYSSSPREMKAVGNLLFFSADDQVIGREPWVLPLDTAFAGKGKP
jgi:ELWxxDGT repeat protein